VHYLKISRKQPSGPRFQGQAKGLFIVSVYLE